MHSRAGGGTPPGGPPRWRPRGVRFESLKGRAPCHAQTHPVLGGPGVHSVYNSTANFDPIISELWEASDQRYVALETTRTYCAVEHPRGQAANKNCRARQQPGLGAVMFGLQVECKLAQKDYELWQASSQTYMAMRSAEDYSASRGHETVPVPSTSCRPLVRGTSRCACSCSAHTNMKAARAIPCETRKRHFYENTVPIAHYSWVISKGHRCFLGSGGDRDQSRRPDRRRISQPAARLRDPLRVLATKNSEFLHKFIAILASRTRSPACARPRTDENVQYLALYSK